jgi:hypothetical protein
MAWQALIENLLFARRAHRMSLFSLSALLALAPRGDANREIQLMKTDRALAFE